MRRGACWLERTLPALFRHLVKPILWSQSNSSVLKNLVWPLSSRYSAKATYRKKIFLLPDGAILLKALAKKSATQNALGLGVVLQFVLAVAAVGSSLRRLKRDQITILWLLQPSSYGLQQRLIKISKWNKNMQRPASHLELLENDLFSGSPATAVEGKATGALKRKAGMQI